MAHPPENRAMRKVAEPSELHDQVAGGDGVDEAPTLGPSSCSPWQRWSRCTVEVINPSAEVGSNG